MSDDAMGAGLAALDEQASRDVRKVWHEGRWWFSIIDVIGLLTDSSQPRRYWTDLKRRVTDEGFREVYAKCVQLKMAAPDGKQRLTDAADTETMLRIIQSIPSPKAEPFKQWLARVGSERLEEIEAPERAADRMRRLYRQRGYAEDWIRARLQSVITREELTEEWRERGAKEGREFAILTDLLHRGAFDLTTEEHKTLKDLRKRDNLRDSMTPLELALTILTETTATALHQTHDAHGLGELAADAHEAGEVGGAARRDVESRIGHPVVTSENYRSLTASATQPELLGAGPASAAAPAGGDGGADGADDDPPGYSTTATETE